MVCQCFDYEIFFPFNYRSFEQGQERVLFLLPCQVPDTEEGTQSTSVEPDCPSDSACLLIKPPETGSPFPF